MGKIEVKKMGKIEKVGKKMGKIDSQRPPSKRGNIAAWIEWHRNNQKRKTPKKPKVVTPPAPRLCAWVPLAGGQFAMIDKSDLELVSQYEWRLSSNGGKWIYAVSGRSSELRMHRLITSAKPGEQVDHINANGLDNRRSNLRICSASQNIANARKKSGNFTSKFKGVCRTKGGWKAQITLDYKKFCLGTYSTEERAAAAYDAAAREKFGEFARCNF
jgi:hypothetical protein